MSTWPAMGKAHRESDYDRASDETSDDAVFLSEGEPPPTEFDTSAHFSRQLVEHYKADTLFQNPTDAKARSYRSSSSNINGFLAGMKAVLSLQRNPASSRHASIYLSFIQQSPSSPESSHSPTLISTACSRAQFASRTYIFSASTCRKLS